MKSLSIAAAALIMAAPILASVAEAASYRLGALEVGRPWSRPAAVGGTGAGFMTLTNRGKAPDALVRVESALARQVEIHRSTTVGGVASMQPQPTLPIPAGGTVTLAPRGYHLMFLGLTQALKPGDAIPATLTFASGARLKVVFRVGTGAAPPAQDAGHAGHDMSRM